MHNRKLVAQAYATIINAEIESHLRKSTALQAINKIRAGAQRIRDAAAGPAPGPRDAVSWLVRINRRGTGVQYYAEHIASANAIIAALDELAAEVERDLPPLPFRHSPAAARDRKAELARRVLARLRQEYPTILNFRDEPPLKHVQRWFDKKSGIERLFYREPGCPRVPLPGPYGSAEFLDAYNRAASHHPEKLAA